MLVFHTILPLKPSVTRRQCVELFIRWVVNNKYIPIDISDFSKYDMDGHEEYEISRDKYTYSISHYKDDNIELTACKLKETGSDVWETNNVYVNDSGVIRLYIQTQFTSTVYRNVLPVPHSPFTIKLFIREGLCDTDGLFNIKDRPIVMTDDLIEPCGLAMQGDWINLLPLVYCSKDYWPTNLPVSDLAVKLQGIAHVVIEPSIEISYKLRKASNNSNVFRGHVGIYLPGQSYHRKFNVDYVTSNGDKLEEEIISTIRSYWLNTEDAMKYSWDQIQTMKSRQRVGKLELKTSHLGEIKELNQLYEEDNDRLRLDNEELKKEKKILYAENERLKEMLAAYRSAGGQSQSYLIKTGEEFDLYPGEQNDLILEILEKALQGVSEGTRPHALLSSILDANSKNGTRDKIEELIKKAFSDNGGISSDRQIKDLKNAGFDVKKPGGHYKITFAGDERYMFTISATPSDYRTAQNTISTITKTLFSKK